MRDETRQRWSAETERGLGASGWFPGRSVSAESLDAWLVDQRGRGGLEMHEAARRFLAEFGDLTLEIGAARVRFVPVAAGWDAKVFDVPGDASPSYLYPLGGSGQGDAIGMARDGAVYMGRGDSVHLVAGSADEALERLVGNGAEGAGITGSRPEIRTRWSALTYRVMRYAAWTPDRRLTKSLWEDALRERGGFEMHEAARQFLAEFGGLRTDEWTPGPIMPQSPFRFDPLLAAQDLRAFARFSEQVGTALYPIGQVDGGASCMGMAEDGAVYVGRLGEDGGTERLADSGYGAVEALVMDRHTEAPLPFVVDGDHLVLPHDPEHDLSEEIGTRWSAETDRVLRLAGWFPGRRVATEEWERGLRAEDEGFVIHEAARRFLAEFGGLEIKQQGAGRSPFRLDPLVAKWDYEIIEDLAEQAGTDLYPLGDTRGGVFYLCMDVKGSVYRGLDYVQLLGESGDGALDILISGAR
ncbi:SUKH-3 domain-containing protein [Streptomyces sp. NPDC088725]|uniref:SUKH-3 domain-containing protein n=1 Tax=Streptomyces sp. NPDC088725 TaxID=3365873 RepID=UPI003824E97B